MKKIAVIDGDSICYICSKDNIEDSISSVKSLINTILDMTQADGYHMFISKGKYFRHEVNPDYKSGRKASKLNYLRTLRTFLEEEYGAVSVPKVEADDLVSFVCYNKNSSITTPVSDIDAYEYIICSIDKDVKKQIEGKHFDYKKQEFGETSYDDAYKFLWKQTLMGDSTDSIVGIPGIGDKKADAILKDVPRHEIKFKVYSEYVKYYSAKPAEALFNFQKNFRQVYLLRNMEDFINEVGNLPNIGYPTMIQNSNEW